MSEKKTCKDCGKKQSLDKFPGSATAKDGHLGYCSPCWSVRMSAARSKRGKAKEPPKEKIRGRAKKGDVGKVDMLNEALKAANGAKEIWQVVAEDGDLKEFRGKNARRQARKLASRWMDDGYKCIVREIHEYRPRFVLEPLG